jgi:D-alanyl-D-alanine carboxypeptidase
MAAATPGRVGEPEALDALTARLANATARDEFSGAVIVARNGEAVFSAAYGLRDREQNIPNVLDTRFCVGSMCKMLTAVAVMQLVQAGQVELSAPFGRYVSNYPGRDAADRATIHHLLTHTGGTGDIFGPGFPDTGAAVPTLEDFVAAYGTRALDFEPGTSWAYSNYGFMLLGLVIERVTGQPYAGYIADQVLAPADMLATSFQRPHEIPDHAVGYTRTTVAAPWQPVADLRPYWGSPAGGAYSTVTDMTSFAAALLSHRLLDAAHTELLTAGKVPARGGQYAYGFADFTAHGARWFGHGGGAPGVNGDLRIYPGPRYSVAVLANLDPPAAVAMSAFAGDRLPVGIVGMGSTRRSTVRKVT